jgi:hypothetical protein
MLPEQSKRRNGILAIRVSTTKQGTDGDSPEAQREQGERYAAVHNISIVKTLVYLESASKEEQPMQHVIDYCKLHKNAVDVVIIKSIDRLTRGGSYHYDSLTRQLDPLNINLIDIHGVISDRKVNTLEHLGVQYKWSVYAPSRKTELLEAERASDELRDILSRMIGSEIRYTQIGYWVRRPLYGFVCEKIETRNGKRTVLKPQPEEALIIQKMFELRTQGTLSDDQIAEAINEMGYRSPVRMYRSKTDRTQIIKRTGGKLMTGKLLRAYIKHTVYAGVNCEKWTGETPVKCKFDGLVSVDLHNKANRGKVMITFDNNDMERPIVTRASKLAKFAKKNVYNADFPYRKTVTCPDCKHSLLGSASRGRLGKYYPAYHCSNHSHYFRVRKPEFDEVITNFIKSIIVDPERAEQLLKAVETIWEARQAQSQNDNAISKKRQEQLEEQIRVIVDRMKLISSETALKYMETDLTKLEEQIAHLRLKDEGRIIK